MASTAQLRTVRPVASLGQRAEEAAPASRIAPLPAVGAAARPAKLGASRSRSAVSAVAAAPAGRSQEYEKFESLLSKYEFRFRIGDKVTGTVFRVENNGLYVDIGAKSSAFCPAAELSLRHDAKTSDIAQPGMTMEFVITKDADSTRDNIVLLSLRRILLEQAWQNLLQLQVDKTFFDVKVVATNRGGAIVELADTPSIRGFIPSSMLNTKPGTKLEELEGKTVSAKILEAIPEDGRLVLTCKKPFEDNKANISKFNVGDVILGTIRQIQPYGAFVEVGNAQGLLHISQISTERVVSMDGIFNVGDKIKVMVLSKETVDGKPKLGLSTRRLEPNPGDMLRNPKLVFEKAEEMAAEFMKRAATAESIARGEAGAEGAPAAKA